MRAFESGADHAEPWVDAQTIASGIRVPAAIGDYLILRAVRDSHGTAVSVTDEAIVDSQRAIGRLSGINAAPEGAATFAALSHLRESGFLYGSERVVLFNTGTGMKYPRPG